MYRCGRSDFPLFLFFFWLVESQLWSIEQWLLANYWRNCDDDDEKSDSKTHKNSYLIHSPVYDLTWICVFEFIMKSAMGSCAFVYTFITIFHSQRPALHFFRYLTKKNQAKKSEKWRQVDLNCAQKTSHHELEVAAFLMMLWLRIRADMKFEKNVSNLVFGLWWLKNEILKESRYSSTFDLLKISQI